MLFIIGTMFPALSRRNQYDLSIHKYFQLWRIFKNNGWPIEQENHFNDFCEALSYLTAEQQKLVLELTKQFLWVDISKYHSYTKTALSKIDELILARSKPILLLPLVPERNIGDTKSGNFVWYLIHGHVISNLEIFTKHKIYLMDKPIRTEGDKTISRIPKGFNSNPGLIILIDDFIGSGNTAENTVNYFANDLDVHLDNIIIVSLVVQNEGYERIKELGVEVYYADKRNKGISDNFPDPIRSEYLEIMSSIETMLRVKDDFRFGKYKSEALVTMNRTPNNTFPIYWLKSKLENQKRFPAPFPR